ncbi:MAG: major capsid protein [Bdellovibrionales bacterium]
MTIMINPFDAGGYGLAEMTQAINILPNITTRLGQLGLFRFDGVTQRSVLIEQSEGVLNLLPSVPLGGPSTVANRDVRSMRSFSVPWIPHDDVITPQDIQGVRANGIPDAAEGIAFPLGTLDTFVTYGAPANLLETVNTMGLPIYARQLARPDGGAIEVRTEASILPVNKRPRLAVRLFSSN